MPKVITLSEGSYQFISDEVDMVHALCDRALVPRTVDGEVLSMAQRVTVMENLLTQLVREAGKADPSMLH